MAEKHLTEVPWKQLLNRQEVKDIGLQRAFAAYAAVDGVKDPEKALDTLAQISELALKLKKANGAGKELVEYLDEVVKEVKRTTPALEARKKSLAAKAGSATPSALAKAQADDDESEEEKEAAEFKKDLKRQMISALGQVKILAPVEGKEAKPQLKFMAYVAGKVTAVVIARRVGAGTKKLLPEIAGGVGAGKFLQGECIFEKQLHTFVLETVPPGLAKKLAAALLAETGVKYKVRLRSTDGSMELDEDADQDPDALPPLDKRMEQKIAFEEKEFKRRQIAARIKQLQAAPFTPELQGQKKQALDKAQELATADHFEEAEKLLLALEARLKTLATRPAPPSNPPSDPRRPTLSAYINATTQWKAAKTTAEDGVFKLKTAIMQSCDPELKQVVQININQVNSILAPIDEELVKKIDEARSDADDERRAGREAVIGKMAADRLSALRQHPLATVADSNPFGSFKIRAPMEEFLTKIAATFGI